MIERCWVLEGRAPMASGLCGWAAWRSVKALLAERQMATNMLSRLGKHWQLHPKGLSRCQLEDISSSLQGAKGWCSPSQRIKIFQSVGSTFVKCKEGKG